MNILNLPAWEVLHVKQGVHDYHVEARYSIEPTACPHCQQGGLFGSLYRHGSKPQLIMDLPAHGKRIGIVVQRRRYRCRNCGRTFPQPLPDVDERCSMTKRLIAYIEKESIRRTFTSIADDVGVHEKTVRNLFRQYVKWLDKNIVFETPEWLGLDEIHLMRKPRLVVTNLKERTIIGVEEARTKSSVVAYMKRLPDKVRVQAVAMDMWKPYRDVVRDRLPHVAIVIDKFHVVRMANQGLDTVRKRLRDDMTTTERRKLMRERSLLLRRPKDLNDMQRMELEAWLNHIPALKAAYEAKEAFFAIYEHEDRKTALEGYREWARNLGQGVVAAFQPLITAVSNWQPEIFAYFDHRSTNACTEALNGIAKNINRNGRGYSFAAIRAKMLYSKTLQKERRPSYGKEWEHPSPPKIAFLEYLDPRQEMTTEPTLGTDIIALWAAVDPDAVEKARRKNRHHSTKPRSRHDEEE